MVVCGDTPSRHLEKTPVLVAEILSPSTRQRDLVYKRESYLQLGVRYYIVVDPEHESAELLVAEKDRFSPMVGHQLYLHDDCVVEVRLSGVFPRVDKEAS